MAPREHDGEPGEDGSHERHDPEQAVAAAAGVPGAFRRSAVIPPPYSAAMYRLTSMTMETTGSNPKVNGTMRAIPMLGVRPGMAPMK